MKLYPLMANLEDCDVLVVGGGEVATRKVQALLGTGAHIQIISPKFSPEIETLISEGKIRGTKRPFSDADISRSSLVFAATDDPNLNDAISQKAGKMGIPINNITNPEGCSFFVPSQIIRGDLIIAISTSGKSPATAKWIRKDLEKQIVPEYANLVEWMGVLREALTEEGLKTFQTSKISEYLLENDILMKLKNNDRQGTFSLLKAAFQSILYIPIPKPVIDKLGLT